MKKVLLLFALILTTAITIAAAELNIYASGLQFHGLNPANRKAEISYFLNAPATCVEFRLLNAQKNIVKTITLSDPGHLTKGAHNNVEIDLFDVLPGDYTWEIKASADLNNQIKRISDYSTRFHFYSPQGLAVDNHTNSPYFGRIYVAESRTATATENEVTRSLKQGIYIFNNLLEDVTNQQNEAYAGGVAWNESANTDANDIVVSMYAPARMSVDEDGYVYICDNASATSGIWRMDPANPANNFDCMLDVTKRGSAYTRTNSVAVTGSGAERTMYVLDDTENIVKFNIGNNTNVSNKEILINTGKDNIVATLNTLVRGAHDDFWIFQYRASCDEYPILAHYNKNGVKDFVIDNTQNSELTTASNANKRGNGAVSPDGKYVAFNNNDGLQIYSVAYDANGKPTLSNKQTITEHGTGKNVDAIAFDVANNLYFVSASTEWFYAFSLPKAENTCTTPAPSSQSIAIEEVVPHIMAYDLNLVQDGRYYKFSFYANSDATAAKILFYNGNTKIGEHTITQAVKKGHNMVQMLSHQIPNGANMTWKLQLTGQPNQAFGEVYVQNKTLKRAHAVIDNSPESDYFGRIYIANRKTSTTSDCYIYDYDYSAVLENDLCGMTQFVSGGRPAVDAEGYVYWADYGDTHGGIWVMNPRTLTTTAFFDGAQDSNGLWKKNSAYLGSSCSGAFVYGSGSNTKLFAMNEDQATGLPANGYVVYNIGQNNGSIQRTWSTAPSKAVSIADNNGGNFAIVGTSHGTWLCQNRSNGLNHAGSYSLMFYDNSGTRKYASNNNALIITGSDGGGMAVSKDESKLVMVNGTGDILLFDIEWSGDVPNLTLHTTYRTSYGSIGSIHFDYAGNLVTTAGTTYDNNLRLVVFSPPTNDNTTIIPARSSLTVDEKVVLLDNEDNTAIINSFLNATKRVSINRSLRAGMCNTICLPFAVTSFTGTPLEGSSVWEFTGATVQNINGAQDIYLNFRQVTSILAGKPYLVEPQQNIDSPMEFSNVKLTTTTASTFGSGAVTCYGLLSPQLLQKDDKSVLFLTEGNHLVWANQTANINGMRAYFKVNQPSLVNAQAKAHINKSEVSTDVVSVENINNTQKLFHNGQLYIIRNGETYNIHGQKVE